MSQLRRNPITGQWVILAENRGERPQEIAIQQLSLENFQCPFCEGQENRTPDETLAIRLPGSQPNGPGWHVRVVPNKYPAMEISASATSTLLPLPHSGPLPEGESFPGIGLHEIIVESPRHLTSVAQLTDAEFAEVLQAYRQRLATLQQLGIYTQATLFKNSGPLGGATLSHLHSQLMAVGGQMPVLGDRTPMFQYHSEQFGTCLLCEAARQDGSQENRLVAATENFVVYCPFASRFAYEMWIVPRQHEPSFQQIEAAGLPELASLFRRMLVKLEAIVKLPAYNYIVHTAPFDTAPANHYHWHIEILPRITNLAGFELGSGCFINAVLPEKAAAALRSAPD